MKTRVVPSSELDPKKGLRAESYIPEVFAEKDREKRLRARVAELEERVAALKTRVSDLKFALGMDATGWFYRAKAAEHERDELRARVEEFEARHMVVWR